jgi:hypothetical protein
MKILTAQQTRECDAFTIKSSKITSWDLMERAASRCAEWISKRLNRSYQFVIVCGSGISIHHPLLSCFFFKNEPTKHFHAGNQTSFIGII